VALKVDICADFTSPAGIQLRCRIHRAVEAGLPRVVDEDDELPQAAAATVPRAPGAGGGPPAPRTLHCDWRPFRDSSCSCRVRDRATPRRERSDATAAPNPHRGSATRRAVVTMGGARHLAVLRPRWIGSSHVRHPRRRPSGRSCSPRTAIGTPTRPSLDWQPVVTTAGTRLRCTGSPSTRPRRRTPSSVPALLDLGRRDGANEHAVVIATRRCSPTSRYAPSGRSAGPRASGPRAAVSAGARRRRHHRPARPVRPGAGAALTIRASPITTASSSPTRPAPTSSRRRRAVGRRAGHSGSARSATG